jgi:hypothetical protein
MKHLHVLTTGEAGHGKDTIGKHLIAAYGYGRVAFADELRAQMIIAYSGAPEPVTLELMDRRDTKNVPQERFALRYCSDADFVGVALQTFESEDAGPAGDIRPLEERLAMPRSYRRIAQVWGTEYRRRSRFGWDSYWIDKVDAVIQASTRPMVITDGRFDNEVEYAKNNGMQRIHVSKPLHAETKVTHDSEKIPQPDAETIVLLNDSTIQDLHRKIDACATRLERAGAWTGLIDVARQVRNARGKFAGASN